MNGLLHYPKRSLPSLLPAILMEMLICRITLRSYRSSGSGAIARREYPATTTDLLSFLPISCCQSICTNPHSRHVNEIGLRVAKTAAYEFTAG